MKLKMDIMFNLEGDLSWAKDSQAYFSWFLEKYFSATFHFLYRNIKIARKEQQKWKNIRN